MKTKENGVTARVPTDSRRAWLGLIATLGPVLVVAMDGSILFLAMPSIGEAINPTSDQSLWILDIYGFVVGSLLITFGNLGDRFGRKRLLIIGAVVFGVGSACASLSGTPALLIAARALMGLGGATLLPSCLAVITELFEAPLARAKAIGVFAATFAAGFVIGPIVGGLLLDRFWWGSVFLVNIPVVIAFLCLAPILLKETRGPRPGRIDVPSVVLSALGLALAIYGVKQAATYGISWVNGPLIVIGLGVLTAFLLRQRRLASPLLDTSLFKERVFAVAILTGLLSLFVWSASAFLSMTYLQSVLGMSVLKSALFAVPGAIVLTVSCVLTPRFVQAAGERRALILCHFSMALGLFLLLFTSHGTGVVFYVASTMVAGIGFGISFSLVADTAVGAVPESRAGAAGAIAETSNEVGNALGIALLGSLATIVFRADYPGDETGIGEVIDAPAATSAAIERAQSAFLDGYHVAEAVSVAICIGLGVLAVRWLPKASSAPGGQTVSGAPDTSRQQTGRGSM
jgi:DHA2 family multidrug resistance protein-like MFS transporter